MKRRSKQKKKTSSPSPSHEDLTVAMKSLSIHVPMDLTVEILSRLPAKSAVRFKCVSKLWSSLITNNSIMTWSLAKPCRLLLLFSFEERLLQSLVFSLSGKLLSMNNGSKSTQQVQDTNTLVGYVFNRMYQYTRGLICSLSSYGQFVIHNPTTRESLLLPKIKGDEHFVTMDGLFGYDPVENKYKVLCLTSSVRRELLSCQIFTLGDPKKQWRNIRGFKQFTCADRFYSRVCIDGKIYFLGSNILMSFDVRSEILFDHGEIPYNESWNMTLVNYLGKVGLVGCSKHGVKMFVMEDAADKQEWSNITRFMGINLLMDLVNTIILTASVTLNGEFVIFPRVLYHAETLYAKMYDLKKNKTRRVEFENTSNKILKNQEILCTFYCFPDHVEIPVSLLDLFH